MSMIRMTLGLALALIITAAGVAQNKYTGAKMCAACHKGGKGGTSFTVWEKSAHANAYKTLLTDAAKKVAADKGLKTAPEATEACLKCHVTGGGTAKNVEASFKKEEGVTCEACHGAASGYKMVHSKGDAEKSKAAGLMQGEKKAEACKKCHNPESPTYKEFKFEEMWAKIDHSKPAKK
jgi:hypothetical protein